MAERGAVNAVVGGSIPSLSANASIAQLAEHRSFKAGVPGSSPGGRTTGGEMVSTV